MIEPRAAVASLKRSFLLLAKLTHVLWSPDPVFDDRSPTYYQHEVGTGALEKRVRPTQSRGRSSGTDDVPDNINGMRCRLSE